MHYGMLYARCCPKCGCGRVVGFTKGDIYGNGPPFVVPGKACHHALERDCVPESAKRIPYHRGILP